MSISRRGIALVLVAGILTLLAASAVALTRMALQFRQADSALIDSVHARLLARSGIEYGSSRLFQGGSRPSIPTPANQADDWSCRDEAGTPLEKSLNPSYAQGEPYVDQPPNGRYDSGFNPYADLDGNGRFDAWSGRLRGAHGLPGSTFVLKILSEGSKIPVNQGYLDAQDRNGNGTSDYADGGGTYQPGTRVNGVEVLPGTSIADHVSQRNRRIPDLITTLWQILVVRKQLGPAANDAVADQLLDSPAAPPGPPDNGPGKVILEGRPLGGYVSLAQVRSRLSPQDWEILRDYLALDGERYAAFGISPYVNGVSQPSLEPESRPLIRFAVASRPMLQALQTGICYDSLDNLGHPTGAPLFTRAGALADFWLRNGPYKSWHDLYTDLDAHRGEVFTDQTRVGPIPNPVAGGQPPFITVTEPVRALLVDLVWANACPDQFGVRFPGSQITPPFSWCAYDLDRNEDGNRDLQGGRMWVTKTPNPNAPQSSYDAVYHPAYPSVSRHYSSSVLASSSLVPYGTLEMDLSPDFLGSGYSIDSLGRAEVSSNRLPVTRAAQAVVSTGRTIRAYTQADFEHGPNQAPDPSGLLVLGRPAKDRMQTYPMFPLDSVPEMVSDPDYRYTSYAGDLRLMDYSSGPSGASGEAFYVPAWEVGQPFRNPAIPGTFEDNFDDVVGSGKMVLHEGTAGGRKADPVGGKDVLWTGKTLYGGGIESQKTQSSCHRSHSPGVMHDGLYIWGIAGVVYDGAYDDPPDKCQCSC